MTTVHVQNADTSKPRVVVKLTSLSTGNYCLSIGEGREGVKVFADGASLDLIRDAINQAREG